MLAIELSPDHVLLQGEFGEQISLPRAFFYRLIEQEAICQRKKITVYRDYVQICEKHGLVPLVLRTFYRYLS